MARFNAKRKVAIEEQPDTVNLAGAAAFQQSPKLELASILLTSMVQDQFYRSANDTMARLGDLVNNLLVLGHYEFVASAGVYARHMFGLRSITHVLAAELAKRTWGPGRKHFFDAIVRRPDDITEILSLILSKNAPKNTIPNAVKDGFSAALQRFDAYQLAKYRQGGKSIALYDAVNLLHPRETEAIKALMNGELANTDTWEAKLSEAGQAKGEEKVAAKKEAWEEMVLSKKIGFLGLLRNLRNILMSTGNPEVIQEVCRRLRDKDAVRKSLVFPFQIQTAMEMLDGGDTGARRNIMAALNDCGELALSNVPEFSGNTLIAMDLSGSMTSGRVGTSTAARVGSLFAASLWKANRGADLIGFGSGAKYWPEASVNDGLFNLAAKLGHCDMGGTNFSNIFQVANKRYDRIIIISDEQGWQAGGADRVKMAADRYRSSYNADPLIYSLDLCGYGSIQFPENKVFAMAGFSDKIFDVMKLLEKDREALVHEIEKIDCRVFAFGLHRQFVKNKEKK